MATLLFVYAPSVNIVSAIYGPRVGGFLAYGPYGFFAILKIIIGALIWGFGSNIWTSVVGAFLVFLGLMNGFIGWFQNVNRPMNPEKPPEPLRKSRKDNLIRFILYPIFYITSPILLLFIKFQAILRPSSKLVQYQDQICSRGEAMLESTPQLCLQLYILLSTLKPSWAATFSMATSAIALSLPSIEKFLDSRHNNDEVKKMLPTKVIDYKIFIGIFLLFNFDYK